MYVSACFSFNLVNHKKRCRSALNVGLPTHYVCGIVCCAAPGLCWVCCSFLLGHKYNLFLFCLHSHGLLTHPLETYILGIWLNTLFRIKAFHASFPLNLSFLWVGRYYVLTQSNCYRLIKVRWKTAGRAWEEKAKGCTAGLQACYCCLGGWDAEPPKDSQLGTCMCFAVSRESIFWRKLFRVIFSHKRNIILRFASIKSFCSSPSFGVCIDESGGDTGTETKGEIFRVYLSRVSYLWRCAHTWVQN